MASIGNIGTATPRGLSLHVGLNEVDPVHYGAKFELDGCINDARAMEKIARKQGFQVIDVLIDSQGTKEAVKAAITTAAEQLNAGDIFLFTYSGHGANTKDLNFDELENSPLDRMDETWCLYDEMLVDDEAAELWRKFKSGVRVFVLLDSCHSGSAIKDIGAPEPLGPARRNRGLTKAESKQVFDKNKDLYVGIQAATAPSAAAGDDGGIKCSVRLISGCQDDEKSRDGEDNGLFTEALLLVWADGAFQGSYADFHTKIKANVAPFQTPNFYRAGVSNGDFDSQKPFTI